MIHARPSINGTPTGRHHAPGTVPPGYNPLAPQVRLQLAPTHYEEADPTGLIKAELATIGVGPTAVDNITNWLIGRCLRDAAASHNQPDAPPPVDRPTTALPARVPAEHRAAAYIIGSALRRLIRASGGPAGTDTFLPDLYAADAVLTAIRQTVKTAATA